MASKFDLNIAYIPGVAPKIAPVVVGFAEVGLGRYDETQFQRLSCRKIPAAVGMEAQPSPSHSTIKAMSSRSDQC